MKHAARIVGAPAPTEGIPEKRIAVWLTITAIMAIALARSNNRMRLLAIKSHLIQEYKNNAGGFSQNQNPPAQRTNLVVES